VASEHKKRVNHLAEISITPFKHKHLPQLIELLKTQKYNDIATISMKTLPRVGYIAFMNNQPIACGFLRRVEPCFAQLDTLASNALFGSTIRHEGIKTVVDTLLLEAKALKIKGIISFTADEGILKRAQSIGFHIVPQTVIAKPL
jgi:hypothetical protein